jgi:hypothetical protein
MTLFRPQYFVSLEGSEEDSESGLTPSGAMPRCEWLLIRQVDMNSTRTVFIRAGRSRFALRARQSHSRHSIYTGGRIP